MQDLLAKLSPEQREVVLLEQRIWQSVQKGQALPPPARHSSRNSELLAAREACILASEQDRSALYEQLFRLQSQSAKNLVDEHPAVAAPYFAHMQLRVSGRCRHVLLGHRSLSLAESGIFVVDWRRAPLAEVFFGYEQGEAYELEVEDRILEGVLEQRHVVTFGDGELTQIATPEWTLQKTAVGWSEQEGPRGARLPVLGTGFGGDSNPGAAPPLDQQQKDVLAAGGRAPLLILGAAGCGKTTVALHRLAEHGGRALVIVPTRGLQRLSERIISGLGIVTTAVQTYDDWIVQEGLRVLGFGRINRAAPYAAIAFKRHRVMLQLLLQEVRTIEGEVAQRLQRLLLLEDEVEVLFRQMPHSCLRHKLQQVETVLLPELGLADNPDAKNALREEHSALYSLYGDLLRVIGDGERLTQGVAMADGELTGAMVEDVLQHTRRQLRQTTEREYAHVDAQRLVALDGRPLDEGTPFEVASTLDVEDLSLLFMLLFLKTGGFATPLGCLRRYDHIVVDEAQEFAPPELRTLGLALASSGVLTVAGDYGQQIDPTACFSSWDRTLIDLSGRPSTPHFLTSSYRCTQPIVDFAEAVVQRDDCVIEAPPHLSAGETDPSRPGVPVSTTLVASEGHLAVALCDTIGALLRREPSASVAIVFTNPLAAKRLHPALDWSFSAQLVDDGEFDFGAGVVVTDVSQVKGLEFDYVVLPDVSAKNYPDTGLARRMLYVGATRARHQLWLLAVVRPSPMLEACAS